MESTIGEKTVESHSPQPTSNRPYYEYKYLVRREDLHQYRSILSSLYGNTDPFPVGQLESSYYDTLDLRCHEECSAGLDIKTKFRLRRYLDSKVCQLQIKRKELLRVGKVKRRMSAFPSESTPWQLLAALGDDDMLPMRALSASYGHLLPVARVSYKRHRFRSQGCRMNLDEDIRATALSSFFRPVRQYAAIPFSVLEIKTEAERPRLPGFGALQANQISFSKYSIAVDLMIGATGTLNKYA